MIDLRPNFNIDPQAFARKSNPYANILPSFQAGQENSRKMDERRQKFMLAQALQQMYPELGGLVNPYNIDDATQQLLKQKFSTPKNPWRVVPGMLSPDGNPIQENETTGEVRSLPLKVMPTGRGNTAFGAGQANWNTAPQEDQDIAKALYEGRVRPWDLGYRDRSVGTKLAEQYALKNKLPAYKSYAGDVAAQTAKTFGSGKAGFNVLALNTALGHLNSAYDAYQTIGNTDMALLNKPLNVIRRETNDPNISRLLTALNAVRGEAANVFKASGATDQEIESWKASINENLTPEQARGMIQMLDELFRSRLDALTQMRESGMSGRGEMPILSPKASGISKRLVGNATQLNPDQEAVDWAQKNPNDPRAKRILQLNGL